MHSISIPLHFFSLRSVFIERTTECARRHTLSPLQTFQQLRNVWCCLTLLHNLKNVTELRTRVKNYRICHFHKVHNLSFASLLLGVKNCFLSFTSCITYVHEIFLRISYSFIHRNVWIIYLNLVKSWKIGT